MLDYIFLMHDDSLTPVHVEAWGAYLAGLRASGHFQGGSAIGGGVCVRKDAEAPAITVYLGGFIRVAAAGLDEARGLVQGNPVFEAGGTVEIRELPRTD